LAVPLFIVILLAIVQVIFVWMGIELAMNPPHPEEHKKKLFWRVGFIAAAIVGIALAYWQYKVQEKTDEIREHKLDTIDTRISNTYEFVVHTYSNTVLVASAGLPTSDELNLKHPLGKLLSEASQGDIVSRLNSATPLETKIWIASSKPEAEELAQEIKSVFIRGGFRTARIVGMADQTVLGFWPSTSRVQIISKENLKPSLARALTPLLTDTRSKLEFTAGQTCPAELGIIVRDE
jgi:hypothetical protein